MYDVTVNNLQRVSGITLGFVHLSSAELSKVIAISYAKKYSWKIVEYHQNDDKASFKTRNLIMP